MLFLQKFSFFCWIIILIGIESELQSNIPEDSTEIQFEGSTDIFDTSTIISVYEGSASPETSPDDVTDSPIHSPSTASYISSRPSTHSTTQSGVNSENTRPSPITRPTKPMNTSTTTAKVEPQIKCNANGIYDGEYDIEFWPPVNIGEVSLVKCPHGDGFAIWECLDSGEFDLEGPDLSNCTDWVDDLETKSNITFVGQAIKVIEYISNKTVKNNTIKESEKLLQVLDIISKVQTIVDNANDTDFHKLEIYANTIAETFSHIMDQKQAWVNSTVDEKANLASKILMGTQYSSYTLSLQQNSSNSFVVIQNNNNFYINTFYADISSELKFPENASANYSTIIIPPNTRLLNNSFGRNNTAIGAIICNLSEYLSGSLDVYHEINSDILSFSLTNSSERLVLNQDIKIILKHKNRLQFGDKVDCAFWDFNLSKWSYEGCYQLANESDLLHTVCKCNHLTNFAALMDVQGRESKTLLKSLLTYICSIISIFGLMFTINLIIRSKNNCDNTLLKGNLNEMRSIITCNLCICLMITNILVIAGMDRTDILWLCQMSSALLLYSLLSSFSWMLMEGYYLYKSLVSCFNAEYKTFYLYLLGYGLPIAIFVISIIVIYIKEDILWEAFFDERYNYFCWISSSHYPSHIWILIGPALCVIFCNCVLMYISLRTAFKILRNQSSFGVNTDRAKSKFKQILSFVFILFMLGITWLSFLFYIHQFFTAFFAYVFIVLNGSQGFFIFLYHLSIFDFKGNRRADSTNSSHSKLASSVNVKF